MLRLFLQPIDPYAAIDGRKFLQLLDRAAQERSRAPRVASLPLVKRGRELNGSLKKDFVAARGAQPDGLPRLMRREKLAAIELLDPAQKNPAAAAHRIFPGAATAIIAKRAWR